MPDTKPDEPPLHPWTVMIKYLKKGYLFFITEIEADSPEEAVAVVLQLGYCLPRDTFELSARRVPVIEIQPEKPNAPPNEPVSTKKISTGVIVRTQAGRK